MDTGQLKGAFCPHCHLLIERGTDGSWPPQPMRCPHCRLLVGQGRALDRPSGDPGAKGTAAGVFSRQAKRDDSQDSRSPEDVLAAIRAVAAGLGDPPERLLMVDYQQVSATDAGLPPLSDVFSTFGSWKRARKLAADGAS